MSSETSPTGESPTQPTGGIGGFLKRSWYAFLVVMNACFWNTYELIMPHKKFDVEKSSRRSADNVIITGGARGIGKEIVRKLLMLDMNVIIGVRSESAAKSMVDEFRKDNLTTGTVDIMRLDLKSFASVKEFANKVTEKYSKIHVLINNAGIYELPYEITQDGYEITFQVNYLSHFLLTNMLLPRLTSAGTPQQAARVVHVSSIAQYPGKLYLNDLWMEKTFGSNWAYANSKLMQAISSKYLNDRLVKEDTPVRSYSVHPGCVASGLYDSYPSCAQPVFRVIFKTNEQGADVVLYAALSPDVEQEGGNYFQNCAKYGANSQVSNYDVQQKLWDASCKATGWEDTFSGKRSPSRRSTPSIVITKDNGAESSKSKVTKEDLEKEGDMDNGNKIDVKMSDKSSHSSMNKGDGDAIPPAVGSSE